MSGLSSIQQLAAAEIAIFGTLFFITIFVAIKHGKKGIMVWQMLVGLEGMVIISGALHIAQNGNPRLYGAGVSFATSGILAMLVLVPIGLIYEICLFIPTIGLWTNRLNLALFHAIPLVSIILGTVFGAPKSHEDTGDHSPVNPTLAKTGWILLLLCLVCIFAESLYLLQFRIRDAINYETSRKLKILCFSLVASLPFAMIRMGHEVAYIFDPAAGNLEVAPFTTVFFVAFVMPLAATIPLIVGGVMTRDINTADFGLVREESRRPFVREDVELKNTREEVEEQQHNRRDRRRAGEAWV